MKAIIKERFKFDYENDSVASYLVLNINSNEKLLEYQLEMLNNNPCSNVLKLHTRQKNDELKLYYNITSKLALTQFLLRKKLKKNEFIDILTGITKTLIDSKEYFLYDNSFLIDEDYIYINPSSLEIGMVYVPLTLDNNASENFKSFIANIIISLVKIDEKSSGNYIQKILNYLKSDIFNISDFNNLLIEIKNEENKITENEALKSKQYDVNASKPNNEIVNQNRDIKISNEKNHSIKAIDYSEDNILPVSREKEVQIETTIKRKYERKYIVIAILSQLLIAAVLIVSLEKIKLIAGDKISAYSGIAVIVLAIDMLLFKKLFKKENMREIRVVKKKKETRAAEYRNLENRAILSKENQNINMSKREIYNVEEPCIINKGHNEVVKASEAITDINTYETVVLYDEEEQTACYLQRMSNGIIDRINIIKSNFIIGRLPNYVDYLIDNNAIGRTHAEILFREGKYFIKDLNSKNGTFLNENKLESNKEYQINNGDKIKFANIEYTFVFGLMK